MRALDLNEVAGLRQLALLVMAGALCAPCLARAAAPAVAPTWHVGGDLGVHMRGEAGGSASALGTIGPRVQLHLLPFARAGLSYGISYAAGQGDADLRASTLYQRLTARMDFGFQARAAWLYLGAGVVGGHQYTRLHGGDTSLSASALSVGGLLGTGVDVSLRPVTLRIGIDAQWLGGRMDMVAAIGAVFELPGSSPRPAKRGGRR